MKNSIKKYSILISILVVGVLISVAIYYKVNIDFLQKIFSIVGSLSLLVALFAYLYKKKQDETLATIGQITFFREEIIPEWDRIQKVIKNKDPKYWFSRIAFDECSIESMRLERSDNFDNQLSVFFEISKDGSAVRVDEVLYRQFLLLNMLEEFSLKVNHFDTRQHSALISVHAAFVSIVESNAVALVFARDVIMGNPVYSATLSVYNSWKKKVTKPNIVKNLEKHGLITEEQMKEIFKKQREKAKESMN